MLIRLYRVCAALACASVLVSAASSQTPPAKIPQVADQRLVVELFAAAPDIVHPIGVDFDARAGCSSSRATRTSGRRTTRAPKYDRIRMLEDTDGDGKADRFTTFFEGTTATMDIAVHPDGSVYVATRNEILRLRDTDGDGKADEKPRIVFLDTKGNYPHNGLSGLCFDSQGDLYFGMGENLGAAYKLIGADGTTLTGGGEGGQRLPLHRRRQEAAPRGHRLLEPVRRLPRHLRPAVRRGQRPRRVAAVPAAARRRGRRLRLPVPLRPLGPAPVPGVERRAAGHAADGDRHRRGAVRGRQLRVRRPAGRVPRQPAGDVVGRPSRRALSSSKERGASFSAERKPFVQGGKDFQPVGLAVAPDGSLFVSDWVLKRLQVARQGRHLAHPLERGSASSDAAREPRKALFSGHRPLREKAARELAASKEGREFLRQQLSSKNVRVRVTSLMALLDHGDKLDLNAIAEHDPDVGIRALAVRALAAKRARSPLRCTPIPF